MTVQKLILKWLYKKINYVSYNASKDTIHDYNAQWASLLISSRIHIKDLGPSESYVIKNIDTNGYSHIKYHLQTPKRNKIKYNLTKYKSFNIKLNKHVYEEIELIEFSKNFNFDKEKVRSNSILLKIFDELSKRENKEVDFIEKDIVNVKYKNIFNDLGTISLEDFKEDDLNYKEFKDRYMEKIRALTKNIKEIGIFTPFVINHDIFKDVYYLCEINQIKTKRTKKNFKKYVETFYQVYGINSNKLNAVFNLERYFDSASQYYDDNFSYFDPFKNFTKYEKDYNNIRNRMNEKSIDFESFLFELFDFFNYVQYDVVFFQHYNLLNSIFTLRSKNRIMTIEEYINYKIKELKFLPNNGGDYEIKILEMLKESKITKNTIIKDLTILENNHQLIKDAEKVFIYILKILNKHQTSTLNYVYEYWKDKVKLILEEYKLTKQEKKIINSMILDLIIFYNDLEEEKLTNPYNKIIREIFLANQNKKSINFNKSLDMNFEKNFIKKYSSEFNKYRPYKIANSEKEIYFM